MSEFDTALPLRMISETGTEISNAIMARAQTVEAPDRSGTDIELGDEDLCRATMFADFGGHQVTPLDEW